MEAYFGSVAGIAGLVVLVTGYLGRVLGWSGFKAQLLSWVVSGLLVFLGELAGFMPEMGWPGLLMWGVGVGLVANGVYDLPTVQRGMEVVGARIPEGK